MTVKDKYVLLLSVFMCGAVVMVMEIIGLRLFAPFFGTSIYVWTSVVGIILASMAAGYFLGGRIADKGASLKQLSFLVLTGSLSISVMGFIRFPVLELINLLGLSLPVRGILGSIILFTIPGIVLAMISPYSVKLLLQTADDAGKISGKVSAFSTVGSIVGVFMAGFVLIPLFGNANIIIGLALVLLFVAVLLFPVRQSLVRRLPMLVVICLFSVFNYGMSSWGDIIAMRDTRYNTVWIYEMEDNGRDLRVMRIGISRQSGMFVDDGVLSYELFHAYLRSFNMAFHFSESVDHVLVIGGAGYGYPQYLIRNHEDIIVDVVEIDPAVTSLASEFFGLSETLEIAGSRLNIFHQDARVFLNDNTTRYDVIFGDAYNSITPPFQLMTQEASQLIYNSLSDNGVFIANIISPFEGRDSQLLRAYYRTLQAVFPQVFLFSPSGSPLDNIQNIIIVALKDTEPVSFYNSNPALQYLLEQRFTGTIPMTEPILTDNHAPVEFYTRFRHPFN